MNFDAYMSYRIKNEIKAEDLNKITTRETTTVSKEAKKVPESDIKKIILEMLESIPENVISGEIYFNESYDEQFNTAIAKY